MSKNKRLSRRLVENKLAEYKTINKQISKKLNENKMEMAKLKKSLQTSRSVVSDLRKQCRRWKRNILKARNVNMDHATMEVETLKSNADKTITILNECIDDVEQFLAVPASASDACTKKRKKPRKKVGRKLQDAFEMRRVMKIIKNRFVCSSRTGPTECFPSFGGTGTSCWKRQQ